MKSVSDKVNEVLNIIKDYEHNAMLIWFIQKNDGIDCLDKIAIVRDDSNNFERLLKIAELDSFVCFIIGEDGEEWLKIHGESLKRQFVNMTLKNAGY